MSDLSLFLGSGASASFGKPTTAELKENLLHRIPSTWDDTQLQLYRSLLSYPPFPDVEYVLECLKNLIPFQNTQGGKFILNTNNDIRFIADGRDRQMRVFAGHLQSYYDFIINELFRYYTLRMEDLELITKIYSKLFQIFSEDERRVNIFTTNYDLAIEKYCGSNGLSLIDGFQYDPSKDISIWKPDVFDKKTDSESTQISLFKIHGSLNWADHFQHGFIRLPDIQAMMQTGFIKRNILIHPTLSPKEDEKDEPYNTLVQKFKQELPKSKVCIAIGFSFRDESVNNAFNQFLKEGNKVIVVSPTAKDDVRRLSPNQGYRLMLIQKKLNENTVLEIKDDLEYSIKNDSMPSSTQ